MFKLIILKNLRMFQSSKKKAVHKTIYLPNFSPTLYFGFRLILTVDWINALEVSRFSMIIPTKGYPPTINSIELH